ncbi:MAG: long-chain fatty acid transport protein [Gemmatimonadetes bacterium]|nr:long-chain fatty acid transport protein [Gemmatimonadota bacterium]
MLHRASRYTLALALLALPAAAGTAGAQAFGLNEIGSCAISRGFANTSSPCDDASSIYWNPGQVQATRGFSFYGGVAAIKIDGGFDQDTTHNRYDADIATAFVPHLFVNWRGAGKMALGLGVYVPYGLTSQWRDNFPGRFSALKTSLQTIYVQPNLAYQLTPNWSIGGGPVIAHSKVELVQGVDLATTATSSAVGAPTFGQLGIPLRTEFARATLKGSSMAYGVDVGVHGRLTPQWQMGARFLSQVTFNYDDADATFEQRNTGLILAANNPLGAPAGTPVDALLAPQFVAGGALVAQKVQTGIQHPAQVQVGFAYSGFQNTTLSADYSYVGWKSFRALPVNFQGPASSKSRVLQEDYNNTSGIRLGAEHRLLSGSALRAGFAANTSAAPPETVTPLLPEQDRALGSLGFGYPMGRVTLDGAYAHIFTRGARGRIDERSATTTSAQALALNSGFYSLSANIFSLSLKANF